MGAPQGFDPKEIIHRIGTFFLLVGIGLLVFFVLSEAAQQVAFSYFCWSVALILIGSIFRSQLRRTVKPSGRFSLVKKLTPKSKREDQGKK
ncbi:MAG TPA: hypothetical protein VK249_22610 [Anaerolineales bacterium]|nr:hypothetical protein [Anaerolineales bacterium]